MPYPRSLTVISTPSKLLVYGVAWSIDKKFQSASVKGRSVSAQRSESWVVISKDWLYGTADGIASNGGARDESG